MEKKCDFFDFGCKITIPNCQNLSVSQKKCKKNKKNGSAAPAMLPQKNGEPPAPLKKNAHNEGSLWADKN